MITARIVTTVVALLLSIAFPNSLAAAEACNAKHSEMLYVVTLVQVGGGSGSGTVIFSGKRDDGFATYVLTNFHVIAAAVTIEDEWSPIEKKQVKRERRASVTVNWFDYNDCSRSIGSRGKVADIEAYDRSADLAVLRLKDRERGVAPVAALIPENEHARLADEAWAVGAGLGQPPFMTRGEVSLLDKEFDGFRYMLTSAPIIFGNSGGALFRRSAERNRYEMIGVPSRVSATGWATIVPHMAWSIPMDTVRRFLRDNALGFIVGDPDVKPATPQ